VALAITVASGWVTKGASSGSPTTVDSGSISVVAGDMLVAACLSNGAFGTISDTSGGTWAVAGSIGRTSFYRQVFSGPATITVTSTTSSALGIGQKVYKVTGYDSGGPIGATGAGTNVTTDTLTASAFTSTVAGSIMLFAANDIQDKGTPTSSDLTAYTAYDTSGAGGFSAGISGTKTLSSVGAQTANASSPGSGAQWNWTAIEILPGPIDAQTSSSLAAASTITGNVDSPGAVTSACVSGSTVTANVTSPASVLSPVAVSAVLFVPVPLVTSTTTVVSTVAAVATPPLDAQVTSPLAVSATVTATATFGTGVSTSTTLQSRATAIRSGAIPPMAPYGTLQIGRLTLTEDLSVGDGSGQDSRTLAVKGQEASEGAAGTQAGARARGEALMAYTGAVVPVSFSAQAHRDGWYRIASPSTEELTWADHTDVRWRVNLDRVGRDSEVEIESRLAGGNRSHASSATAELWHAPAVGHGTYYVGASTPGFVDRTSADGLVRCYRAIPAETHPRWAVPSASAMAGAASVTVGGNLLTGLTCDDTAHSWELSNGLLKVEPRDTTGTLILTSYLTSDWSTPKIFDLKRGSTSLGMPHHVTVLRNDPCEVVIRLTWDHAPGRTVCDLTLARGARHVGIYAQQYAAPSALRVDDNGGGGTVSDQLTAAGYIERTDADPGGDRWVIGTTVAASAAGTFGLQASVAAVGLAAYIGAVRAGGSAVSGDTAANINSQFLGYPAQSERMVRR
jgi:hypothetical protein